MYKEGKWAAELLEQQDDQGLWGPFHSLSVPTKGIPSTEQALRRLEVLGFTMEDQAIQRPVEFMDDCILRRKQMPDRREKSHNWDLFSDLMFAAWIRRFSRDFPGANRIAEKWAAIVTEALRGGRFSQEAYKRSYEKQFKEAIYGPRFLDPMNFYLVSLLSDQLDDKTEGLFLQYILSYSRGIYYIREKCMEVLPESFQSRDTTRFLSALELLLRYKSSCKSLGFALDWIEQNRSKEGTWDLGSKAKDSIYLPLSDSWRSAETRISDCTYWVKRIIKG